MIPGSLDYETIPQYKLTITVSDPGGLTAVQVVDVNILGVNEAPVIQNLPASVTIAENGSGKITLATVITIDEDGDGITYTIPATSAPYFEIDAAGKYFFRST